MKKIFSHITYKSVIVGIISLVVVVSGISIYIWHECQRPKILEIFIIPLKTGQSLFIRTPQDHRILVDGGTNSEIIRHISEILPFYTRRIDKIIVTRADGAHTSGLVDVVDRYDVGEVIVPGVSLVDLGLASSTGSGGASDQIYKTFITTVDEKKIPIKEVVAGDRLVLDDDVSSLVVADVLFPVTVKSAGKFTYSKASAPELVFNISYGSTSVMVIGSVTTKIQKFVATTNVSSGVTIASSGLDVLVTSKNPIKSNLAPTFLAHLAPKNIIYSKAVTKSRTTSPNATSTSIVGDVSNKNLFNIREVGTIKVTSNGKAVEVNKILD